MTPQEIIREALDLLPGMWRYRWWAAGVAWLISVGGWLFVYSLPDIYEGSARVFVDANSLLRPLLRDLTVPENPADQVQLVSRAVLTRPNLEVVAHRTDLALRAETPEQLEALISGLQRRITLAGGRDNIYTISYQDVSREKAREVVSAVLDIFIENALGRDFDDADLTEQALANEIRDHEERLRRAEEALGQFKKDNIGYMPGSTGDYYTRLQNAIAAEARTQQELQLLIQRREELRRQLEGEEPIFGMISTPMAAAGGGCSVAGQIGALENERAALLLQYTERHPRVEGLNETIALLREQCTAEERLRLADGDALAAPVNQPLEANPIYQSIKIQLSGVEADIAELRAQLASQQEAVATLRADVDKITDVETQLKQLNRDYEVIQDRHQELLRRWEDLQAKKRIDPMTNPVQFRTIEPPFSPAEPVGPNRQLLLFGVLAFTLASGAGLAFGMNTLHPVFYSTQKLRQQTKLPVLGSVSMVLTAKAARLRRLDTLTWGAACVVLLVGTAAAMKYASLGSQLLRNMLGEAGA